MQRQGNMKRRRTILDELMESEGYSNKDFDLIK